jgi:hypothetical protein
MAAAAAVMGDSAAGGGGGGGGTSSADSNSSTTSTSVLPVLLPHWPQEWSCGLGIGHPDLVPDPNRLGGHLLSIAGHHCEA